MRLLRDPVEALTARTNDQVIPVLEAVESGLKRGYTAAGYLSYEAAGAYGLSVLPGELPVAWFGLYRGFTDVECPEAPPRGDFPVHPMTSEPEYLASVERIRRYIAEGDTYQANLTMKLWFEPGLHPFELFLALQTSQPVPYAAYLDTDEVQIASLSPELFFRVGDWAEGWGTDRGGDARKLWAKPMKGTAPRGRDLAEDRLAARNLAASEKERAENLMIVDMVRNDVGKVCEYGSVATQDLFAVERYATLHQMTGTVTGRLRDEVGPSETMRALFPSGSITGAPKRRTMEIIRDLERAPRGVYTGAIGFWRPDGCATFNVAIRTIEHRSGRFELGVGSGITWGSSPTAEYEETRLKAEFLFHTPPVFRLFETLLVDGRGRYRFLREHLRRLRDSAFYWDFPFDQRQALDLLVGIGARQQMVRLTLDRHGGLAVESRPFQGWPSRARLLAVTVPARAEEAIARHKTTERGVCDAAMSRAVDIGCDEALLVSEDGLCLEGCVSSLVYRLGGRWFTPPLDDGLLPGIWREKAMKRLGAPERRLSLGELGQCERLLIGNSVRGEVEVTCVLGEAGAALFGDGSLVNAR